MRENKSLLIGILATHHQPALILLLTRLKDRMAVEGQRNGLQSLATSSEVTEL
jgi:hypothetical protein